MPATDNAGACAEMLKALLHCSPDFIYFKDAQGRFVSVSASCRVYAPLPLDGIIGKTDFELLPRDQAEALRAEDRSVMQTGVPVSDKIERRRWASGRERWVSVTKAAWKDNDGTVIGTIGVCRDVTDRIEREKHILDMLSIASHDIRGPLVALGSTVKLLMRGAFGLIDESVKVTLADLFARINRLEKIVGEYLCKSSVMNTKMPEKEFLDVRQDIIDPLLDEFSQEIGESAIRIDNTLGAIPGNSIIIKANANWVRIVYRNLIRNAIKYAAGGYIAFGFEDRGDHYRLNVYNSGPPVPEERRDKIFERFESRDSTGLGLTISRELIQKHGGDMWYENTWDNHPNFIFTIPK